MKFTCSERVTARGAAARVIDVWNSSVAAAKSVKPAAAAPAGIFLKRLNFMLFTSYL